MDLGQRLTSVKFLITDRAGQLTSSFDAMFTAEGIRILASPPQAPRANAICERIIGTLRRELFDRLRRRLTAHRSPPRIVFPSPTGQDPLDERGVLGAAQGGEPEQRPDRG